MCESKVDFFSSLLPWPLSRCFVPPLYDLDLVVGLTFWMLESYYRRSRPSKIQNFPRGANHGG